LIVPGGSLDSSRKYEDAPLVEIEHKRMEYKHDFKGVKDIAYAVA
jgi:hypothetical protein